MASLPDSPFAKWVGFLSGLLGLSAFVVPAVRGMISANFVTIAFIGGIVLGAGAFYTQKGNASLVEWTFRIAILAILVTLWTLLTAAGNAEIARNFELLNRTHYYIIEFFGFYSLIAAIVIFLLSFMCADVVLSVLFRR